MRVLRNLETFATSDPEAHERCGLILSGDVIVELPNNAEDPKAGFLVTATDLDPYIEDAWATWHTHPGSTSELSVEDLRSFQSFEGFRHFIVGEKEISVYVTKNGLVVND